MIHLYQTTTGSSLQHIFVFKSAPQTIHTVNVPCSSFTNGQLLMSIYAHIYIYICMSLIPAYVGANYFLVLGWKLRGISAHTNMVHIWDHKGWPHLCQLCTPAKAALWSKALVTGDPTSAIFPICSFSLQSGPGLIPPAEYSFSAGTYHECLWRRSYNFLSSQRKASRMFWDSSVLQTKTEHVGRVGRVASESAL